ncbi:MAG: hypothetical protein LBP54_07110, partial [Campylobacteraceae bacterium]|nr:hypothetical protein [Campylobacteraceae bacterium]
MSDSISTLGEHLRQKAINDINKDRSPFAALLYAKNMLEANKAVHEQASNIFSITGGDDNKRQDEAFLDAKKQYNEAKALNFEAPYSVQRMEKSGNYPKYLLSNLQEIPEISLHYTASSIPFLYNWAISVGGNTRAASTAEKYKENNNIEDEKFYNDDWREYKNKAKSTQLLTKYREAAGAENLVAGIGFIPTGGLAVQALKGGVKQGFKKTVANSLKKQGEGFLSEAIGEGAEAATGTILENIANNKKWNEDLGKEVLNSATIGGVVGAN